MKKTDVFFIGFVMMTVTAVIGWISAFYALRGWDKTLAEWKITIDEWSRTIEGWGQTIVTLEAVLKKRK